MTEREAATARLAARIQQAWHEPANAKQIMEWGDWAMRDFAATIAIEQAVVPVADRTRDDAARIAQNYGMAAWSGSEVASREIPPIIKALPIPWSAVCAEEK